VFDARGAGNGWLLPAGPLREPLTRLRTVDALVFNGEVPGGAALVAHAGGVPAYPMRIRAGAAWSLSDPTRLRPLTSLRGVTLQAVAGIGQPQRFFDLLRAAGLQFTPVPLSDHHDFRGHVFSGGPQDLILMTEKDAVKCLASNDPRLWAVPIDAEIPPGLVTLILEKLRGSATA